MRYVLALICSMLVAPASAETPSIRSIIDSHVLPGYSALAQTTAQLADAAAQDCAPTNAKLLDAYHDAFDAWIGVSHLRFGPSEEDARAFALAFWPDPRGSTPKTLAGLIRSEDPVVSNPADFATVSVAARGFYALEFLLFDSRFTSDASPYHCALVQAVSADIAENSAAILTNWEAGFADLMAQANNDTYRTQREAAQQLFTALTTGLEFTANMRVGRPLGTFDRPRPNRAEARRSERSLRNVVLSLTATRDLAMRLSDDNAVVAADFDRALERAEGIDDPIFASVADPAGRFRVEALQNSVITAYRTLLEDIGPDLGITAGFNSLDGD